MDRIDTSALARALADARAPRYTSYPPANRFSPQVGPVHFATWLAAIPADSAISVYVHIPFCRRLCRFCACRTQGTLSGAPIAPYLETLALEIERVAAQLAPGIRAARLHWGGGTPTMLDPAQIARLAGWLEAAFPRSAEAEFSVEIDPTEIDAARLDALAAAGLNRASLGVQDFEPQIQQAIGREQSAEATLAAADALRARGVGSLNLDLLYGLPFQTEATLARTLEKVVEIAPDRIALYGYAHVPWMSPRQKLIPAEALPDAAARLDLFAQARERLLAAGYVQIGIDHFARPADGLARAAAEGRLRRNFQGYTDDGLDHLIGLGASSISRLPQGYAQNAAVTRDWKARLQAGGLATARGHSFSADDLLRGRAIEMLMCDFRIDAARLAEETGTARARVAALWDGLDARFADAVRATPEGLEIAPHARPLARLVAAALDAYAPPPEAHSLVA